jgi:hypothetical protein
MRSMKYVHWRVLHIGIWDCVIWQKFTDVSEEHIASIFKVGEPRKQQASSKQIVECWKWKQYFPPKRR